MLCFSQFSQQPCEVVNSSVCIFIVKENEYQEVLGNFPKVKQLVYGSQSFILCVLFKIIIKKYSVEHLLPDSLSQVRLELSL